MSEIIKENLKEEVSEKKTVKKNKKFLIMGIMWALVIVLGVLYYNINKNSSHPKVVFQRTDEVQKELKDKIYIYYPLNNYLENMEVVVPRIESEHNLVKLTVGEVIKKLKSDNIIPVVEPKDVNFYVSDEKIYLDLPEKIFDKVTDAKSELLVIYSFVNSLTNINGIEKVRILINGVDIEKVKYANLMKDYTYTKTI